ncbi:MAG: preprotein translocase subunit Sec61beta [Candidatus Marsarchaeota archaeon]|jgi:preprotein translocase subunit Sec61beta|nr:preprotein translocase subunit Sec61beta [Candidatus Marsarchaeota archaeon]
MALYSPQSQAGVLSFYDAPSKGPKINPKFVLIGITAFAIVILIANHFLYYAK